MINKEVGSVAEALEGVTSGSTVLVGGFGDAGVPLALIGGLIELGLKDLTLVTNNSGSGDGGVAALIGRGMVAKIICSYPRSKGSTWFAQEWLAGRVELEVVPQGTMSERMRAAAAGLGGFFTPVGADTILAEGREVRVIDGRPHLFETPIHGDVALVQALRADRWGNLTYDKTARNFGPTMVAAAKLSIVEVSSMVELGELDPEVIVSPGIFVDRVVCARTAVMA